MSPEERNRVLKIPDHQTRRKRGDLIYMYKLLNSSYFTFSSEHRTRGHSRRLRLENSHNNIRKHSFSLRNILAWNNLPENVISAENLNVFKSQLDQHLNISF